MKLAIPIISHFQLTKVIGKLSVNNFTENRYIEKKGEELPRCRWTWVFQPARIIIVKLIKPEQQLFL